jgi:hypothetical protein
MTVVSAMTGVSAVSAVSGNEGMIGGGADDAARGIGDTGIAGGLPGMDSENFTGGASGAGACAT